MKAQWRGEIVRILSVKNGKVQIARKAGLRWVKPAELTRLDCVQVVINTAWLATEVDG